MDLVNRTPVPARLLLGSLDDGPSRFGILVAKATFAIVGNKVELVTQAPYPLFDQDKKTDLGVLPSDVVPRRDRVFEVLLLGAACAGSDKPVVSRVVEVSVGTVTRRLVVFGDRHWDTASRTPRISDPVPFQRLPMTYDRAWGGSCPVHFDAHTVLDVEDRMNKHGCGFDAEKLARDLGAGFKSPAGFPRLDYVRRLPNLEHPAHLIRAWTDAPEPYCWATVPADIPFRMVRLIRKFRDTHQPPTRQEALEQAFHRAHPDWIISLPPPGARVVLTGVSPDPAISFPLPPLRVMADYVLGGRTGTRELAPHSLILLPEARRCYVVYRAAFTLEVRPRSERGFRLRLAQGWFEYPDARAGATPAVMK